MVSSGIEVDAVTLGPQVLHQELLDLSSSVWRVYTSTNTDLMHHVYRKYAPSCPGKNQIGSFAVDA